MQHAVQYQFFCCLFSSLGSYQMQWLFLCDCRVDTERRFLFSTLPFVMQGGEFFHFLHFLDAAISFVIIPISKTDRLFAAGLKRFRSLTPEVFSRKKNNSVGCS